jgi:tRNA pseudouridine55 synthase
VTAPFGPGLLLVHKRVGETSFGKVRELQAQLAGRGEKLPVSHAGALDPFAEGLVILLLGPATRLMDALHVAPKRYVAEVRWGTETDSGDGQGRVTATGEAAALTPSALEAALVEQLGWRDQVPPTTSNKRVEGERAYLKAHRGEQFELPPSRVYLHEACWIAHALPQASTLELVCGGGYYVRALARDLGRATGARAHLSALRRTGIGPWADPPEGAPNAITHRALLPWCPSREVSDPEANALRQGGAVSRGNLKAPEWPLPPGFAEAPLPVRAFQKDRLVALARQTEEGLRSAVWLRGI